MTRLTEKGSNNEKKRMLIAAIMVVSLITAGFLVMRMLGGGGRAIDNEAEAPITGEKDTLVVYFSWFGNVQQMARWVADEADADLIRVTPTEEYSSDFNDCTDRAQEELNNGTRPEITIELTQEQLEQYDTIYVGFPVLWYDLPMPMWTFIESYEFTGKTIIPFLSHNGSSTGASSLSTLENLATNATVLKDDYLSIKGSSVPGSEQDVRDWVKKLGDSKTTSQNLFDENTTVD